MYTNKTRITGLSGIDTESLIKQMMKAESLKYTALKKSNQLLLWKQEAYRSTATALTTYQSSFLNFTSSSLNLRSAATYKALTASVTDAAGNESKKITVSASGAATVGSHTLEVLQTAKKDIYVSESGIKSDITGGDSINIGMLAEGAGFNVTVDGVTKKITFTAADLEAITNPQDPGDGLSEEERLAEVLNGKFTQAFGTVAGNRKIEASVADGKLTVSAKYSGVMSIEGDETAGLSALGMEKSSTAVSTGDKLEDIFGSAFFTDAAGEVKKVSFSINGVDFEFFGNQTLDEMISAVNNSSAGVKMTFESSFSRIRLESKDMGTASTITFGDGDGFIGNALRLNTSAESHVSAASDAVFRFDGMLASRATNVFTISDLTFNITGASDNDTFTVGVKNDTDQAMKAVLTFVEEYNKLVEMLNKAVNTTRPRSDSYSYYEPLTDEEREAMTEEQIKLWEEKAKTGMLYRDEILTSITSTMRSMMYQRVDLGNGKSIALYDIGITTTNKVSEGGKLVVDEEKLKKALEERIDDVAELFTKGSSISSADKSQYSARLKEEGLAERLNDIINAATNVASGSLTLKAGIEGGSSEKNNAMYKQISDNEQKISDMLLYLQRRENFYYEMFAKLEASITQSNAQMDYMAQMFGGTGQ